MTQSKGTILSEKRKQKKLTQEELAQELFVTRQAVSNWERDITIPDPSTVEHLSSILGENLNQLFEKKHPITSKERVIKKMDENNHKYFEYEINKYDTAIGLFYAVALFIGSLISILFIYFNQLNFGIDWLFPVLIGLVSFLLLGLLSHAIITLARKNK